MLGREPFFRVKVSNAVAKKGHLGRLSRMINLLCLLALSNPRHQLHFLISYFIYLQAPDLDVDPFKPRKNMMANSPPSTPKTLAVSSAAGGDNNKGNAPTSPFLSSAELASPTALKGICDVLKNAASVLVEQVCSIPLCYSARISQKVELVYLGIPDIVLLDRYLSD